jgi:hypothetical protein
MAKAFTEGKLPEPARLPRGTVDQQAAALAKAVSLRDESSLAALYAAVLAAGFSVRDSDGSLMQTTERGHGLILDGGELAATAKYVREGGLLFVDACGGSAGFATAIEQWLAKLDPAVRLEPMRPDDEFLRASVPGAVDLGPEARPTF